MDSPFCDGKASLIQRKAIVPFRKEHFEIVRELYVCDTTGMEFSTEDQDQRAFQEVYRQYREKYKIPNPNEIRNLRERYGLTSTKMSLILGMGINQIHKYEEGEIPSLSNSRLLIASKDKNIFLEFLEATRNSLTDQEYSQIKQRVEELPFIAAEDENIYGNGPI